MIQQLRLNELIVPGDPQGQNIPRIHRIVTEGLVSWWDFRGGYMTTTLIDRIGGNDGAITNTTAGVFWGLGKGQAIFDGVDELADILNSVAGGHDFTTIGNSDNFTIEAWALTSKAADTSEANWYGEQTIIELRTEEGAGSHVPFHFGIEDTFIQLGRTDDHTVTPERQIGTIAINDGNWHHLVCAVTDDVVDFYVDRVLDVQRTFTTATGDCSVGSTTANMQIGCRARDGGEKDQRLWDGRIGMVRIYSAASAFDAGDVSQNYEAEQQIYGI